MSDSPSTTPKKKSNQTNFIATSSSRNVLSSGGKTNKWKNLLNSSKKDKEKRISSPEFNHGTPFFTNSGSPSQIKSSSNHLTGLSSFQSPQNLNSLDDFISSPADFTPSGYSNMRFSSPRSKMEPYQSAASQNSFPNSFQHSTSSNNSNPQSTSTTAHTPRDVYKTPVNQIHSFETQFDNPRTPFSGGLSGPRYNYNSNGDYSTSSTNTHYMTPQSSFSSPFPPTAPKIKPFAQSVSSSASRSKKSSVANAKCCVCEEFLSTKFLEEKLVELVCGDMCHEECLKVTIDIEISHFFADDEDPLDTKRLIKNKSDLVELIFPDCLICQRKIVPRDSQLIDHYITKALLSQQYQQDSAIMALGSTLKNDKNLSIEIPNRNISSASKSSRMKNFENDRGRSGIISPYPFSFDKKASRGSSISAVSSIISSASRSRSPSPTNTISTMNTTNTTSIKINSHSKVTLEVLKAKFINYLITSCQNKISIQTLRNFGNLRLVDQLSVSFTGGDYEMRNCYLFFNYFVVFNLGYDTIKILNLAKSKIETPDPSVIKIAKQNDNGTVDTLYLTGDTASIIEKWGVALSDFSFTFPSEIFTSTIVLPEFQSNSDQNILDPDQQSIISTASTLSQKIPISGSDAAAQSTEINSVNYNVPIKTIIMVVNNKNFKNATVFKKVLRALLLKYTVQLILSSNSKKSSPFKVGTSNIIYEKEYKPSKTELTSIEDLDDVFENLSKYKRSPQSIILSTIESYLSGHSIKNCDEICTIIISDSSIELTSKLPTSKSLLIELATLKQNNDQSVLSCSNWDGVMECICTSNLKIDFDMDSDMDSDSESDSDYDSCMETDNFNGSIDKINFQISDGASITSEIASKIRAHSHDIKTTYLSPAPGAFNLKLKNLDHSDSDEEISSESDSDEELITNLIDNNPDEEPENSRNSGSTSATTITGENHESDEKSVESKSQDVPDDITQLIESSKIAVSGDQLFPGLNLLKKRNDLDDFSSNSDDNDRALPQISKLENVSMMNLRNGKSLSWGALFSDIDRALDDLADWDANSHPTLNLALKPSNK